MNPTWSADRIDEEARGLAAMPEDVRRITRRGDWDYVFALHHIAQIAAGAGLRHMAAQKADFAAETEANIRAVGDRVAAMTANAPVSGGIPSAAHGQVQPVVRRVPIDFRDIARQSGCTKGRLCKTAFGWGVQNGNGGVDFAVIEPPPMRPGETSLRIEDNEWCFCAPNKRVTGAAQPRTVDAVLGSESKGDGQ